MKIQWTNSNILPQNVVDILYCTSSSVADEVEQEVEEDCEIDNLIDVIFEEEDDDDS